MTADWATPDASPDRGTNSRYLDHDTKAGQLLKEQASNWPSPDANTMNDGDSVWFDRRDKLKEKGINGNGAGMPLAIAASNWMTPDVPGGGRTLTSTEIAARGSTEMGKRQVGLENQASLWATPTGHERTFNQREVDSGIQLANQAALWGTPRVMLKNGGAPHETENARGRLEDQTAMWAQPACRDAKDGTSADADVETNSLLGRQSIRSVMPDTPGSPCFRPGPDWVALALSIDYENFTAEALDELGQLLRLSLPTRSDGETKSSQTGPNSDPPSPKRKSNQSLPRLNPLFSSFLMGWSPVWILNEQIPLEVSGMESFRQRQAWLLSFLLGERG